MKPSCLMAVTAASIMSVCVIVSQAMAQQMPPRPAVSSQASSPPNIALLDVSFIFKNHPRFKAMREELEADVRREEANVNRESDAIRKLGEQLDSFRKGSPDFKAMEEEIARRQADLTVKVQLQRKEFLNREAKIYNNVYQEIEQEVGYYCANRGIDMVLRFNGDEVDVDKPDSVLSYINKPVVWYDKSRDITPFIRDALVNRNGNQPAGERIGSPPARPGASSNPFHK